MMLQCLLLTAVQPGRPRLLQETLQIVTNMVISSRTLRRVLRHHLDLTRVIPYLLQAPLLWAMEGHLIGSTILMMDSPNHSMEIRISRRRHSCTHIADMAL